MPLNIWVKCVRLIKQELHRSTARTVDEQFWDLCGTFGAECGTFLPIRTVFVAVRFPASPLESPISRAFPACIDVDRLGGTDAAHLLRECGGPKSRTESPRNWAFYGRALSPRGPKIGTFRNEIASLGTEIPRKSPRIFPAFVDRSQLPDARLRGRGISLYRDRRSPFWRFDFQYRGHRFYGRAKTHGSARGGGDRARPAREGRAFRTRLTTPSSSV